MNTSDSRACNVECGPVNRVSFEICNPISRFYATLPQYCYEINDMLTQLDPLRGRPVLRCPMSVIGNTGQRFNWPSWHWPSWHVFRSVTIAGLRTDATKIGVLRDWRDELGRLMINPCNLMRLTRCVSQQVCYQSTHVERSVVGIWMIEIRGGGYAPVTC